MVRLNLRDDQWERIRHLLLGKASDRGRTCRDNRRFVAAVLWLARPGAPRGAIFPKHSEIGTWKGFYEARNLVKRFFNRIKHFRCVAIRYDKLSGCYQAFVAR